MESLPLLQEIGLPIFTAVFGWFANVWRTKQKKEADILDNVTQILEIQKNYIASQDEENKKTRDMNAELERALRWKRGSIMKANFCQFTNEGDGCPVLKHEAENDESRCKDCQYNKSQENADGKD